MSEEKKKESSSPKKESENDYTNIVKIGEGGFSMVYRAQDIKTNELVAIKRIKIPEFQNVISEEAIMKNSKLIEYAKAEYVIMSKIKGHKNICELKKFFMSRNYFYYILEYCGEPNLKKKIAKKMNEQTAFNYFLQIFNGWDYIASMNIVHRDLKPENILFSKGIPKITDFGLSKTVEDITTLKGGTWCGTIHYKAPEQLENASYGGRDFFSWKY